MDVNSFVKGEATLFSLIEKRAKPQRFQGIGKSTIFSPGRFAVTLKFLNPKIFQP